ncbi:hypothetical protein H310_09702 [Aphanomyces invadans]|uniref:DDE Tnp4 domain-containing protein n=1 Tax=Aphanomyces invadans TaxID=157072 RepID=A0A024TVL1_9STRA|nr:hypothetical protein H310_09702 [Aphanomyces invadans]ETV97367.1 hypothetical protein H310_09702 [Aphanomyces invadans]|eukprot:XP_008874075.1 hypothetical protein H310_09702 [Aphanomyces invadans]
MDSIAIVTRLQQQVDDDTHALNELSTVYQAHSQQVEEADDTPTPVIDSFFSQGGNAALTTMSNFTLAEIETIWAVVEPAMVTSWTMGRGRKSKTSPKDAFFMLLSVLKHCNAWDKHALDFNMKAPTFEKMIQRVIDIYVMPVNMTRQVQQGKAFANFPSALYCTDVKFQPSYRPTGRFDEAKHYFSGKHKLYGLKLEYSVAYPGVAVDISDHTPGSVSDLTIFKQRRNIHQEMLRKSAPELDTVDHDEGSDEYPDSWSVLVDMGYQGLRSEVRAIHPTRRPQGGLLSARELERNGRVSSDQVLVENYFGRICSLWKIMRETYKWNENRFDVVSRLCCALTNAHVSWMPLRGTDGIYYHGVLSRYSSMSNEAARKRSRAQAQYRARRARHLELTSPQVDRRRSIF